MDADVADIEKHVINLEYRLDRRCEMEIQLNRVGWKAQFSGSLPPTDRGGFPSIGARGCFQSHLSILRNHSDATNHLIIIEDDLNFSDHFEEDWPEAIRVLEKVDWSIFYAGHILDILDNGILEIDATTPIQCSHFVMFHRRAIPAIITGLETILSRPAGHPLGGPMHVDGAYSTIRGLQPSLRTFAAFPSLGYQRSSRSDIANLKFFDRLPVVKTLAALMRRWKRPRTPF